MARNNDTGLKQLENGNWQCRIYKRINGVQHDKLYRIDERTGQPFTTKKQARDYRDYIIAKIQSPEYQEEHATEKAVKFSEVWDLYLKEDSIGKAPNTIKKYSSVWENHLKAAFGDRYVSGKEAVSVQEINNYLSELYYNTDLTYGYIEGFLRLFYCLYGNAYRRNIINAETISKYTKEKSTHIRMPAKTSKDTEDEGKIEIYDSGEIEKIASVFKGTDLEPAFMIAYYCGLRESEIFGLMWEDIDFKHKTITVNKQLVNNDGVWCISRVKTLAAVRVVDMPDNLYKFMVERHKLILKAKYEPAFKTRAREVVMDTRDKTPTEIVGGDFVNRKLQDGLDGKLLTVNSLKFYSKRIKELYGFPLKMHKLRKTHLSYLASHGYPLKSLMERAGHKKLETSMKYYIAQDETMREQALRIINTITTEDPVIFNAEYVNSLGETVKVPIKQSQYDKVKKSKF